MENEPTDRDGGRNMERLLSFAVPMWIDILKHKSFREFEGRRDAILESVCYKGDLLLYGSKKKGETAKLFNDLAEGLAWLALIAKGGVTFGDQHWDAEFVDEGVSDMQKENQRTSKPKKVRAMRGGTSEAPAGDVDGNAEGASAEMDREEAGD